MLETRIADAAGADLPNTGLGSDPQLLEPDMIEDDLLVEEVSIDGMCGVY